MSASLYLRIPIIFEGYALRQKTLWFVISLIMLMLGINKHFHSLSWLTGHARVLAYEQGWYAERGHYQTALILTLFVLGAVGLVVIALIYAPVLRSHLMAIAATLFLVFFVFVRSVSLHLVDQLINARFVGYE